MLEYRSIVQIVVIESSLAQVLKHNKGFNGRKDIGIFLMIGERYNENGTEDFVITKPNVYVDDLLKYPIDHPVLIIPKDAWNKQVRNLLVFNLNNN